MTEDDLPPPDLAAPSAGPGRAAAPADEDLPLPVLVVVHGVIPGALITMLCALLFFLIDLRSVFMPQGEVLKWIGACFVGATVLIIRYGRMYRDSDRQGTYLLALAVASLMAVSTLSETSGAVVGRLSRWLAPWCNGAIFAVVFALAAALTRRLSLDEDAALGPPGGAPGVGDRGVEKEEEDPARGIALLGMSALPVFALGERWVLAGDPQIGPRALLAMIAYCLATGVLLAAGSAAAALRAVRRRGGTARLGVLPLQVGLAAGALCCVLTAALGVPGVRYRGSGAIARQAAPRPTEERGDEAPRDQRDDRQEQGKQEADRSPQQAGQGGGGAGGMLQSLAELGKWLLVPVIGLLLAGAGATLWRARATVRGLLRGWPRWLRLLLGRRRGRGQADRAGGSPEDPWRGWEQIAQMEPADAVRAAYGRLLGVAAALGHQRPPRQTPLEFLYRLPRPLQQAQAAAKTLTELYMQAAYARGGVGVAERAQALEALQALRVLRGG